MCLAETEVVDKFSKDSEDVLKYVGSCGNWLTAVKFNIMETLELVRQIQAQPTLLPQTEKEFNDQLLDLLTIFTQSGSKVIPHQNIVSTVVAHTTHDRLLKC